MNKEAARPSVCTHTEPKTLVWTPQERNPNITPTPSTDTCGQCHSTDKRGAGGRDRHRASPRTTQTPKYPTGSPNAGCGCRQYRIPSCRRNMPRQVPVRTHFPQHQNTLSPPEYMLAFAASCGSAAQWGAPCLCRNSRKSPPTNVQTFVGGRFFMRNGMPIRCSPSGRHDRLYQCFLSFTQKKTPRRDLIVTKFFGSMLMKFI